MMTDLKNVSSLPTHHELNDYHLHMLGKFTKNVRIEANRFTKNVRIESVSGREIRHWVWVGSCYSINPESRVLEYCFVRISLLGLYMGSIGQKQLGDLLVCSCISNNTLWYFWGFNYSKMAN